MTAQATWLLALLFLGHFIGDFTPLAGRRIQEAKAAGTPAGPIAAHAAVHGILVSLAVLMVARPEPYLVLAAAGIQFLTHFGIDWIRGRLGARHPNLADSTARAFWLALGLDQLAHALVLVGIASLVL